MARIDKVVTYAADRGFVYGPAPEIYGGLAGFYTYGPLGKLLKNNVEEAIRKVFQHHDFYEVECPTVMPKEVWEASGHLGGFMDPVVKCEKCKKDFRVDHIIEEGYPDVQTAGWKPDQFESFMAEKEVPCPSCKGILPPEIEDHVLMMRTTIGLDQEAYNRPETATTTYLHFPRYLRFFRDKLPFGVFQIGKAYRNEISPRQFVVRMREFTQAEGQLFIYEDQKKDYEAFLHAKDEKLPFWSEALQKGGQGPSVISLQEALDQKLVGTQAYAYVLHLAHKLFNEIGIPDDRLRIRQHHSEEKAFYAKDAWDLEIKTESFGWIECCGIHDRGSYDLEQHEKFSKTELKARDEQHEKQTPHVIEIAFGTDRPLFALLDIFYSAKEDNEERDLLSLPKALAPVKVAVFPLVNKLHDKAMEIYWDLKKSILCMYDKGGSVGRRYARADEVGVPYCVTVDFETLEGKGVTVRDRDSTDQVRVPLEKLTEVISGLVSGALDFSEAGQRL
ncbi:MAG: glycine--tRNA ligase [Candidatus Nanoarchaeia archaeon]